MDKRWLLAMTVGWVGCSGGSTGSTPADAGPAVDAGPVLHRSQLHVDGDAPAYAPRFAHLSQRVVYQRDQASIAVANLDGTAGATLAQASQAAGYLASAVWSHDDSQVYFTGDTLSTVPAAGGTATKVIDAFASLDPDLSPDETKAVYAVNGGELQLVDLTAHPATQVSLGVHGAAARFSPDGTQLVFAGNEKLNLMKLSDRSVTVIVDANDFFASAAWFKDGKHLLAGTDKGIELIDLTTTPPTRRLVSEDFDARNVDLSADEKTAVFSSSLKLYLLTGF